MLYLKLLKKGVGKAKWLLLIGLIFFPIYLIIVNMVMADSLLAFLLVSSFILLGLFVKDHDWWYLFLFNIVLSLAIMTKPVMMYFWVINLFFSGYIGWKIKKVYPLMFSLILLITVSGWSYRNYIKTGYYHFSSIKMQNLLELNAGAVLSYKYDHEYKINYIKNTHLEAEELNSFKQKSDYLLNAGKSVILKNKLLYSILHIKGMMNFMLAPGRVDVETFFKLSSNKPISLLYEVEKKGVFNGVVYYIKNVNIFLLVLVILIFLWNIISLILLLASFLSDRINGIIRLFLFLLLLYIVFASGPGGYARFKTEIYPIMLYLIPFGYLVINTKIKKHIKLK